MEFNHSLWGLIVPDGPRFCHWGGKPLSRELAERLRLQKTDCVLDLCCGEGGLTDYLGEAGCVVGVDISANAISKARQSAMSINVRFEEADAFELPFPNKTFTKAISQDADAWMNKNKGALMREIARVLQPGGTFLWQSYITTEETISPKTASLLRQVGYTSHDMPRESEIPAMFAQNGFKIETIESLQHLYAADNLRMLSRARALHDKGCDKLLQLLEWEKVQFENNIWKGVLVTASRSPD